MFRSVHARFIIIVIVSLISMIVFILSLKISLDKLSAFSSIDKKIEKMNSQILKLRKDEKNFFIRRESIYLEQFDKDFETFIDNTKGIKPQLMSIGFEGKKVDKVLASAEIYNKAFKGISAAYLKRGLTHNDGLRGELNKNASELTEIFKDKPESHILLLQMRDAEKNFFTMKKQFFADKQAQYFELLKAGLTNKEELSILKKYQDSFLSAYNLRIEIGIDNSQGHVYQMLTSAQDIQEKIEEGTKVLLPLIAHERATLTQFTYIIFFITSISLFLIIASSARKLTLSFKNFIQFFKEAKTSYSHLDEEKAPFIEFSKLSVYANEMIDARVKAENELQDLNLHLEERVEDGIQEIKGLNKEIVDTQKEVVFTMGAIGESRSKETGNHVKRVAQYSYILAKAYGLSQHECDVLKEASPMHDIGKIGIPDAVLNKPGRFDAEERAVIETHASLGYEMLKHSKRELLLAAATVSHEHHEKWNGTGYPRGLKGEDIHIYGRITALADVFDALGSDRVYKKAWEDERIFSMFKEERAEHFDPGLIDCFFENLDKFLEVRDTYRDIYEEV